MNHTSTLAQVFKERVLEIPDYQRGYAWGEAQWQDFFDDVILLPEGQVHYTGTVVLHPQPGEPRMDREGGVHHRVHVVDGQQRLCTVVLFLDALRRQLLEVPGREALAEGVRKAFVCTPDDLGMPLYKLQLAADLDDYWRKVALADEASPQPPIIRSHRQLRDARRFFEEVLRKHQPSDPADREDWLVGLFRKVTQRLKVTVYEVESSAEVGVIFEVMNNRGRPLSELEKAKNFLLYLASKLSLPSEHPRERLVEHINRTWSRLLERMMAAGLTRGRDENQLLQTHWLVAYDPDERHWQGSRTLRSEVDLRRYTAEDGTPEHGELLQDVVQWLDSLDALSVAFCDIYNPWHSKAFSGMTADAALRKQLVDWTIKLHRIGVLAPFLPLLSAACVRYSGEPESVLRLVQLCERFAFRVYRMHEHRSNKGRSALIRQAHRLYQGSFTIERVLAAFTGSLHWHSPEGKFIEFWGFWAPENDFYHWGGIRYFLYEYEIHVAQGREVKLEWSAVQKGGLSTTIEHVAPQTPEDRYWRERFDEEQHKVLVHDLGNLCLTQDNSSYSNKPFPDKRGDIGWSRPCYARSFVRQEQELARWDEWTPETIAERREALFEWAKERWAVEPVAVASEAMLTTEDHQDDEEDASEASERSSGDTRQRITVRWSDLAEYGAGVSASTTFALSCGGRRLEAWPVMVGGRGKPMLLREPLLAEALDAKERALAHWDTFSDTNYAEWMKGLLEQVAEELASGRGVPMGRLTAYLQSAFTDGGGEANWETPTGLWHRVGDGKSVWELDEEVRRKLRGR
jgi:hypothetical protein